MVKLLLISNDISLQNFLEKNSKESDFAFSPYSGSNDPLDIMSNVCGSNPSLLIIDDDFIKPISERLLTSIKKVNPKLPIIFITSRYKFRIGKNN